MIESIVIQRPEGAASQLFLLFHGVCAQPSDMVPLAERLAQAFPQAVVVCVAAPEATGAYGGRQWFSIEGVTDDDRPRRVAEAMPAFVQTVRRWQADTGVAPEATALVGFSQGAIMALESSQLDGLLAGRVVALAGRFARLPERAPAHLTWHFIHGKADPVIHYGYAVSAAERLIGLGGDVTADVIPFLGHGVNDEVVSLLIERLTTHLPQRVWQAAMSSAEPGPAT